MDFPERVSIVEVAPRDGLQSLSRTYPTSVKVELIELLARTGLTKIEVTGFVRPEIIPQLADGEEVFHRLHREHGVCYRALCPNRRGAERAVAAGADEILGLITASETYNYKNSRMTISDNLDETSRMAAIAHRAGIPIVMAIGVSLFCPYEGKLPPTRVLDLIDRMRADGIDQFYVATSAGVDGPRDVRNLCGLILDRWPGITLGVHLHNTNGMALANALTAMDVGVGIFEGSICGIGGGIRMPSQMSNYGNVATEDLVQLFAEMRVETGIELKDVILAAHRVQQLLNLPGAYSHAANGGTREDEFRFGQEEVT